MDTDLRTILETLGLTKVEVSVFSTIIELNNSSIGRIIKQTQLHRGTVYNTMQRLIQKGLVYTQIKEGQTIYYPNPQGFLSDLADEQQKTREKYSLIKEIKSRMNLSREMRDEEQVRILRGVTAYKNFFLDLLNTNRENEEVYKFIGNGGNVSDFTGLQYYRFSQELKMKLGVKCKVILNEAHMGHPDFAFVAGNIKWVEPDYNFGNKYVWTYDNKVVIVTWKNPIHIEIIEGKDTYKWYNSIFRAFWKNISVKHDEYLESNIWKKKAR
ncbi:MAG: helix-turn-helix domain-containing protein [Nanoarchaeota archaeon]